MLEQGYNKSYYDSCLYFKRNEVLKSIYLLMYVDDMLLIMLLQLNFKDIRSQEDFEQRV